MPNLRQQLAKNSQSEAFLLLGLFDKTTLQIVPKNGLLVCTSSLQVLCHYLQVKFTSAILSVLCLTVILTVIYLDSSF
jgi:hypothetical protein